MEKPYRLSSAARSRSPSHQLPLLQRHIPARSHDQMVGDRDLQRLAGRRCMRSAHSRPFVVRMVCSGFVANHP